MPDEKALEALRAEIKELRESQKRIEQDLERILERLEEATDKPQFSS